MKPSPGGGSGRGCWGETGNGGEDPEAQGQREGAEYSGRAFLLTAKEWHRQVAPHMGTGTGRVRAQRNPSAAHVRAFV